MDFAVFDTKKIDAYAQKVKEQWGKTEAYKEFEQKEKNRTAEDMKQIAQKLMVIFAEFGSMMHMDPESEKVQKQVKKLADYISEHFYRCTEDILRGLGKMYAGGGEFTENIDKAGGEGCAEFTAKAIEAYCSD